MPALELHQLEYLADDVELRRAAAKTLKAFGLTYRPHHFRADPLGLLRRDGQRTSTAAAR